MKTKLRTIPLKMNEYLTIKNIYSPVKEDRFRDITCILLLDLIGSLKAAIEVTKLYYKQEKIIHEKLHCKHIYFN